MKPFKQAEVGYTATAKTVVLTGSQNYDVAKLDNPVRAKVNAAVISANLSAYRGLRGAL